MDMEYIVMVPPTVNDEAMTELGTTVIRQTMGETALLPFEPIMGSEDFSFFAATVPGLFVMIGASNADKGIIYPNHHPQFDIDEDCLEHGSQLYVGFAKAFLAQGGLR
jgi:amidohydrolase